MDNSGTMDSITIDHIQDIITELGAPFAVSPATLAYINNVIVHCYQNRDQFNVGIRGLVEGMMDEYPTGDGYPPDNILTLTPWDFSPWGVTYPDNIDPKKLKITSGANDIAIVQEQLKVTVTVNGIQSEHLLTMDMAMGMYLFAKVVNRDLHMTMYGVPLTYFNDGEDDKYIRDHNDLMIQMVGSDRKYYFRSIEFLYGIKTAAMWFGLDHREYWTELKDSEGSYLNF